VFFKVKIIGGEQGRSLPPINFYCDHYQVKIEFSATNTSDKPLKLYWPSTLPKSNPIFQIDFHSTAQGISVFEDTLTYLSNYELKELKPGETIKTFQYISNRYIKHVIFDKSFSNTIHFYDQAKLKLLQNDGNKKGTIRISYPVINNDLNWRKDSIWKPTDAKHLIHMGLYSTTNACK